jgi:uncharacterized membrane protein
MRHIVKTFLFFILLVSSPLPGLAQNTLHQDLQGIWHAEVVEVVESWTEILPPDDIETAYQTLRVRLNEGKNKGDIIEFENDYVQLEEGQKFFISYYEQLDGRVFYSMHSIDRRGALGMLFALFALILVIFSGKQGLRSLMALAGSLIVILYVLVPSLVSGFPPVLISIVVAISVLFFAIFLTHGFNRRSLVAFGGTTISIVLTGILALVAIHSTYLTGFASDESVYLNFNTGGTLDFVGLLLAGVIVGVLGVLDDIAITQVAVVRELFEANPAQSKLRAYKSALRVGREHIGALVNTLVLAYTGTALPLILLFSQSASGYASIVNQEIFATEIVRTLVGSIGLILAVPITTLLAVYVLAPKDPAAATQQKAASNTDDQETTHSHHSHHSHML